jgi:hypothetical protein
MIALGPFPFHIQNKPAMLNFSTSFYDPTGSSGVTSFASSFVLFCGRGVDDVFAEIEADRKWTRGYNA